MIRKQLAPIEKTIEKIIFTSRWLLVPFYLGLVLALIGLLVQFSINLYTVIPHLMTMSQKRSFWYRLR